MAIELLFTLSANTQDHCLPESQTGTQPIIPCRNVSIWSPIKITRSMVCGHSRQSTSNIQRTDIIAGSVIRHGPNKLVFNSQKALHGMSSEAM